MELPWRALSPRMGSFWVSRRAHSSWRRARSTILPARPREPLLPSTRACSGRRKMRARVVNMSFAGPADPVLHRLLAAAYEKDMVLIAAAGMQGPNSGPLYPAADPNVIAVTATDSNDSLYKMANRGHTSRLRLRGSRFSLSRRVKSYQITTGTSVAAAHVSGIAALLLERQPSLKPADIRAIIMTTAEAAGIGRPAFGFGCRSGERLSSRDVC